MHEIQLDGCRPSPLAHYLKALGVLRLVSQQLDPSARGAWRRDTFVLFTERTQEEVERFFLEDYAPTPIVSPWNGGSGFYPKDNKKASEDPLSLIVGARCPRLEPYRGTIELGRSLVARLAPEGKVAKSAKIGLQEACRSQFSDVAIEWLDAAVVLCFDTVAYPPLLGTGGNDGNFEFSLNFMQRLLQLVDTATGHATADSQSLLRDSLFSGISSDRRKGTMGQFSPTGAGGVNASSGFEGNASNNPWDYLLMLEGSVCFAASIGRRNEREPAGVLAYPFTVRQSAGGYGSAAETDTDSSRAEMWLPLWQSPASLAELTALFSEGRARVGGRSAATGTDFARAVATLGVDRGIEAFERIGFQARNGLAYFATPLGRQRVGDNQSVRLLDEIDGWLKSVLSRTRDSKAPAAVRRHGRRLDEAIVGLCQRGDRPRVIETLLALSRCELAIAASGRWAADKGLRPIPPLSAGWADAIFGDAGQRSTEHEHELQLARSLASLRWRWPAGTHTMAGGNDSLPRTFREHLEPVRIYADKNKVIRAQWADAATNSQTWRGGSIVERMNRTFARRLVLATGLGLDRFPDHSAHPASLAHVTSFVEGQVDDRLLSDLVGALALINWSSVAAAGRCGPGESQLDAAYPGAYYALLRSCYPGGNSELDVRMELHIHRLAAAGQGMAAAARASRRLRASGFPPQISSVSSCAQLSRRAAAALLFPLHPNDVSRLLHSVRPITSIRSQQTIVQGANS